MCEFHADFYFIMYYKYRGKVILKTTKPIMFNNDLTKNDHAVCVASISAGNKSWCFLSRQTACISDMTCRTKNIKDILAFHIIVKLH